MFVQKEIAVYTGMFKSMPKLSSFATLAPHFELK
jgi:hypothetical protein